jgi:hypothetical protein
LGLVIAGLAIVGGLTLLGQVSPDPVQQVEIDTARKLAEIELQTAAVFAGADALVEFATAAAAAAQIRASITHTAVISPMIISPSIASQVVPTTTPVITAPVVTTTPVVSPAFVTSCVFTDAAPQPFGEFLPIWSQRQAEFGCPQGKTLLNIDFAMQEFNYGKIFWLDTDGDHDNTDGDADLIFAISNSGKWQSFTDQWFEGYNRCDIANNFGDKSPSGGIGKVWCEGGRELVGDPKDIPTGGNFFSGVVQCFEKGCLLHDPINNQIIVLHSAGARWEAISR